MVHNVELEASLRGFVQHKDIEFKVYTDDEMLGTLRISKGTAEWCPKNHRYGYHLTWEDLADLMQAHGRRRRH